MFKQLRKIPALVLDIVFPRSDHVRTLEETDPSDLAIVLPRAEIPPDPRISALFDYKNATVRAAVWEIKYRGNTNIARKLAILLYEEILDTLADAELFEGGDGALLVPMPISGARRRVRGFNQTELVCAYIAAQDERILHYAPNLLVKTRDTAPQTSLKRSERLKNLDGCFAIEQPEAIQGRRVILVDDVVTTGATAAEAMRVLEKSGARSVRVFAIAH